MGAVFTDLTCEELCDLMCGKPEEEYEVDQQETSRDGGVGFGKDRTTEKKYR